ncbi:MAG: drug:proton antiporter, partial [Pseudomonadota bacterium]
MSLRVAATIARRELRGGLGAFRVFILCLALGVTAIAAVGSVRTAIEAGLAREGAALLGGDAEMRFTYRYASDAEKTWMAENALRVSEIVDFRSMAVVERGGTTERGLTQVKGIDSVYPLKGAVVLNPDMPLDAALAGAGGLPGAVMQRVLIDRLGLQLGDSFKFGTQSFVLTAELEVEPDNGSSGFSLGPRTIVLLDDIADSGLLAAGTLFESNYRLELAPDTDLEPLEAEAVELFRN